MGENDQKPVARVVTVDADEAERRLDNFLISQLNGVPRSRIYRMIRSGEVRVNKGRVRPDRRLRHGDQVRIPPVRLGQPSVKELPRDKPDWLEARILHEDRDLLVLDKPAGLAVHGGSGLRFGVIELMRQLRGDQQQLELVHRLDRETSGCLLIAKRRSALRHLHEQFRSGDVQKRYLALLHGSWKGGNRIVEAPLEVKHRRNGERHVIVSSRGKAAYSKFMPMQVLKHGRDVFQLTEIEIETGRTHQIRAHAEHLGHPVAGDERYGPQPSPAIRSLGLRRLFLHARVLAFDSPRGDRVIRVEAPLDPDLQQLVDRLSRS